jgi:multidrug transporter EmrE-like cation transporter
MMHTPVRSMLMILIAAFLGAIGQYLYKEGAGVRVQDAIGWLTNWRILVGLICYIGVMVLFISAFKIGGELTVLYPLYASTFIWAMIIGKFVLGENIGPAKLLGVAVIAAGMFLIGRS